MTNSNRPDSDNQREYVATTHQRVNIKAMTGVWEITIESHDGVVKFMTREVGYITFDNAIHQAIGMMQVVGEYDANMPLQAFVTLKAFDTADCGTMRTLGPVIQNAPTMARVYDDQFGDIAVELLA